MNEGGNTTEARVLQPLWLLTTGIAFASIASLPVPSPGPFWIHLLLLLLGAVAFTTALVRGPRANTSLWLLAGLAFGAGRGLEARADDLLLQNRLSSASDITVRAQLVISEGWSTSRWGRRTRVLVLAAHQRGKNLALPRKCPLEVRGAKDTKLPEPGSVVETLATVRQSRSGNPMLIVASSRVLHDTDTHRLLPTLRGYLARKLMMAAETNPKRIRTAELAAALALGRRDMVPRARRDAWRRSGLAHLLAVSGLHVGLVGGAVWILVTLAGAGPRTTRIVVLIVLPTYALLAGASPSAMRAALMGCIYLGARLIGRAILPMAAVLLTAAALLLARPGLIAEPGFQLTVVITAALVRWVPPLTEFFPGPRWLGGIFAVPLTAQAAAAPIVAWHFRSFIPGSLIANLVALPFLGPTVLASVLATVLAPLWPAAAGVCLSTIGLLTELLRFGSTPARALELVTPSPPIMAIGVLITSGWLALQSGKTAKIGVLGWIITLGLLTGQWFLPLTHQPDTVELAPVTEGAAILVNTGKNCVLIDGGRQLREAAQLLADRGIHDIDTIIASHTDEDHIGGLGQILRSFDVDRLLIPNWMFAESATVALLRTARLRGVQLVPVTRGTSFSVQGERIDIIWAPARDRPREENERSIVARLKMANGTVLITSDIGQQTERRLAQMSTLKSDILIVPHHGSRASSSSALLDASRPVIALIPAGPGNTHGHPHHQVLERLAEREIEFRYPARDGWCGARFTEGRWVAFP